MAEEAAKRTYARIHEKRPFHDGTFKNWSEHASDLTPFHFTDGVEITVAEVDLNPDDAFLTFVEVQPLLPPDEIPINDPDAGG